MFPAGERSLEELHRSLREARATLVKRLSAGTSDLGMLPLIEAAIVDVEELMAGEEVS